MAESLSARMTDRLIELAEQRGFKKALADRMSYSPSAITPYINGSRPVSLDMLEAISEVSAIRPAELIAPPGSVYQVSPDEAAILRALRQWPPSVTTALSRFLAFFADEAPGGGVLRDLHELLREMSDTDRRAVYGFALMRAASGADTSGTPRSRSRPAAAPTAARPSGTTGTATASPSGRRRRRG